MYFGSHVSISKGYLNAAKTALAIGAKAFQYFPKNPRSLSVKSFDKKDTDNCAKFSKEHNLLSISHAPYPTNLAIDDQTIIEQTILSIKNDLEITEACGSIGLVVHFGNYKGTDLLKGYQNIVYLLNEVLEDWNGNSLLLIENQAGQGTKMGMTIEELVQIRNLTKYPEKIGYCFDTCHAFASDLWNGDNHQAFLENGEKLQYFKHIKAIHLNDSVYPNASYRDRHANIGKGYIGEKNIKRFLELPFLEKIPIILETPQSQTYTHQEEITYLRTLV